LTNNPKLSFFPLVRDGSLSALEAPAQEQTAAAQSARLQEVCVASRGCDPRDVTVADAHVDAADAEASAAASVRPLDLLATLPAELAQISHARSAAADESGATVLRAHGRRVFVHNADAATTAMLTDTLNPAPKAKTSKADKKLAIRDAKRKVTLKPKLKV